MSGSECWVIKGLKDGVSFFREVGRLLPEATHVFLEGSSASDVVVVLSEHRADETYGAPVGTLWSWPRERRFSLRASPALITRLAELAAHHAELEICCHLHFYRHGEALAQWFDAFGGPLIVSKVVPRERVERFCSATGGVLDE